MVLELVSLQLFQYDRNISYTPEAKGYCLSEPYSHARRAQVC